MNQYTFYQSGVRQKNELVIGSSDIPVIIKTKNSRIKKSSYELWEEKTGKVEPFQGNNYTTWGHELEPLLISAFIRKKYNAKIAYKFKLDYVVHQNVRSKFYNPMTIFHPFTECKHPQFPWAIAHGDCVCRDDLNNEILKKIPPSNDKIKTNQIEQNYFSYLLEAKTGGYYARVRREDFEGFDLDDHTATGVPSDILLQVQWQMLIYDIDFTYVLLLVDDNKFHIYEVPAIKKWFPLMLEKASQFLWCCKNDKPPQPEKYDDIKKLFPEIKDKAVYVTGEKAIVAEQMKAEKKKLQAKMKKYQKRIDDINNAAGLLMGENKFLFNGETSKKLFQQVITKDQYNMIHPSAIQKNAPNAFKILEEKNLINKSDRRYVR